MSTVVADRAHEALRMAESDPGRSAVLARNTLRQALAPADHAAAAVCERALGLVALHTADLDTAMQHLRSSMTLAGQAGSRTLAALARMSFAFALVSRGRAEAAVREIDAAVADLRGL